MQPSHEPTWLAELNIYVTDKDDNSANNVIGRSMTIMASQVGH
jgi:hypothetical protein